MRVMPTQSSILVQTRACTNRAGDGVRCLRQPRPPSNHAPTALGDPWPRWADSGYAEILPQTGAALLAMGHSEDLPDFSHHFPSRTYQTQGGGIGTGINSQVETHAKPPVLTTVPRTPLMNRGESSSPNSLANSTASFTETGTGTSSRNTIS